MSWFNRHINWALVFGLSLIAFVIVAPLMLIPEVPGVVLIVWLLICVSVLLLLVWWYLNKKGYAGWKIVLIAFILLLALNVVYPGFARWFGGVLPIVLLLLPNRNRNLLIGS